MGEIAKKARELWGDSSEGFNRCVEGFAEAIDTQLETLRQEIRDLKGKKPEPDLQRGDFVSYMDVKVPPHRVMGDEPTRSIKVWGLFHHQDQDKHLVWAYFQDIRGDFRTEITSVPRDKVTFELRPEK